jgi:AraC-like DNA-binding protein
MTYIRSTVLARAETALRRAPLGSRSAIAAACRVSPSTLSRVIHDSCGESFRAWQRRIVLARTQRALIRSGQPLSLKEVAAVLSFNSPSTLARWFRAQTGLTPTAYRAQHDAMRHRPHELGRGSSGAHLAGGGSVERAASHSCAFTAGDADV